MKRFSGIVLASFVVCGAAQAQAPATAKAPAGSTAQCNDGSFSTMADRASACRDRKGLKTWFGQAGEAVQTQSPAVSATRVAPTTGVPSRTPATPENPVQGTSPAPRALPAAPK